MTAGTDNTLTKVQPLTVAALSLDIAKGNPAENLRRVEYMIKALPPETDVAVVPELFTTSFMKDTDAMLGCAEFREGATMRTIRRMAHDYDMLLCGSYLGKDDSSAGTLYYNRGFMVLPDSSTHFYDKHHLFCLSEEARLLTHGHRRPPIVNFRGWNLSMIICYELRFPVWDRNVDMATDVMLVPANWPVARGYAWRHLLIARAIENQCVMVGGDRSGSDDYGEYGSLAMICDELGRRIAPPLTEAPEGCPPPVAFGREIATDYGPVLVATFDYDNVASLRKWLPTDRDADCFTLHSKTTH